jgi:heat-inducible transcriptional repressor
VAASKVMVVIVAQGGQVSQKMVDIGEPLGPEDLRRASEYVNREFTGMPLLQVREAVMERLLKDRHLYDRLMARAFELASRSLADAPGDHTLFVEGASTLLEELGSNTELPLATLRALLQMMEEKQRLVRLLNEYLEGPGLTVVIGAEHSDPNLRPFSLVASTFFDGQGTGSLGVIGPTRMRYSKAISMVDHAAQAVSRVLRGPN